MSLIKKRRAEAMKKSNQKVQWLEQGWSCSLWHDKKVRLWVVALAPFPAGRLLNEDDLPVLERLRRGLDAEETFRLYPDDGADRPPGYQYAWMEHPQGRIVIPWNMRAAIARGFGWPEPPKGPATHGPRLIPNATETSSTEAPAAAEVSRA